MLGINLLKCGIFELRKCRSRYANVLKDIPLSHRVIPLVFTIQDLYLKILGLMWDSISDCCRFHVSSNEGIVTKRKILSYIAKIYNPLEFMIHITFHSK